MKWSTRQQEAIEARNCNLLVSAAAGAGKTAVLIQRILSLVEEGTDVENLLVVTFTKAAAGEMRERLLTGMQRASDQGGAVGARFSRQAMHLSEATISTLHSFCLDLLKTHFEVTGIDPSIRVLETEQCNTLRMDAMDETLSQLYEEGGEGWLALDEAYGEQAIAEMIEELHGFALTQPDPWHWLASARAMYELCAPLSESLWIKEYQRSLRDAIDNAELCIQQALRVAHMPGGSENHIQTLEEDAAALQTLQAAVGEEYPILREALLGFAFKKMRGKEKGTDPDITARTKKLRDDAKKEMTALGKSLDEMTLDRFTQDIVSQRALLDALCEGVRRFDGLFTEKKRAKGGVDYSDLEHLALRTVAAEGVAEALRERFDYIFVDEYQDSSSIQEALVAAIARPDNCFFVGDVKQSIYSFRQAKPALFLQKHAAYQTGEGARDRKIDLNQNFRARPGILEGINQVFAFAMRGDVTDIEYDAEARLYAGQQMPGADPPIEVCLREVVVVDEEGETRRETTGPRLDAQAAFVAQRIHELVGTPLWDARAQQQRTVQYRDIVILLRTISGKAFRVERALSQASIPVFSDVGEDYFELPEVRLVLCLLQLVDNPVQDEPLLAGLRSVAGGISDAGLATVRLAHPEGSYYDAVMAYLPVQDALAGQLQAFMDQLSEWRFRSRYQPLADLVEWVIQQSSCYMRAGALPGGQDRQANLRLLSARAASFEQRGQGGLTGFLKEIEQLRKFSDSESAKNLGENEDVVRIMSMHKSKGLEFPVVFCLSLDSGFSRKGSTGQLLHHDDLGIGLRFIDAELRIKHKTLPQLAIIARQQREQLAEEVRLLYVAMTRAQDRLILVGDASFEKSIDRWTTEEPAPALRGCKSMMDLILTALYRLPDAALPQDHLPEEGQRAGAFVFHQREAPAATEFNAVKPAEILWIDQSEAWRESEVARQLLWKPPAFESHQVLKTSVSGELLGNQSDILPELVPAPDFMMQKEPTGALVGTGWHAVMRALPLDDLRASPRNEYGEWVLRCADQLVARGVITERIRESIRISQVVDFLRGDIGQRMLASDMVYREWAFNLREDFPDGGFRLVQGVLDCAFREADGWVLVDFKTDRPDDHEALIQRYKPQLAYYAKALTQITGRPVNESVLYLLRGGKALVL